MTKETLERVGQVIEAARGANTEDERRLYTRAALRSLATVTLEVQALLDRLARVYDRQG